jgi:putative transcriptional regulator
MMASVHEAANDFYRDGSLDKKTMREFDALCLTPVLAMTPEKIRALRAREKTSQTVFAAYLNVTPSLVSKWERGEKHPQGASLKLLSLVDKKGLGIVA